jgi:hypothetical protein
MLLLDANILIRAVLGSRVLFLLRKYAGHVEFLAPDTAFRDAGEHILVILERRRVPVAPAMALNLVAEFVQAVESENTHALKAAAVYGVDVVSLNAARFRKRAGFADTGQHPHRMGGP